MPNQTDFSPRPVHITKFSPQDSTQLVSCSDDTTVKLWDIPSEAPIHTFVSHTDYVRAGQISPSNPSLILTGSYDATVRLFDARTGTCTMTMGADLPRVGPVEDVLMFPSGSLAVAATGNVLRVWDLVAGGRCVRAVSNHQKSVTSLAFDGSASRLLTGGLDHMVKVYDVATYRVVHTMRYPAPILSLAVSVSSLIIFEAHLPNYVRFQSPTTRILLRAWWMDHSPCAADSPNHQKVVRAARERPMLAYTTSTWVVVRLP